MSRRFQMRLPEPLSVEELEPRYLLSGLTVHVNFARVTEAFGTTAAQSGGLSRLSVITTPSTSGIFTDQSTNITNPLFPLMPGTVFNYAGEKDGQPMTSVVTVTNDLRKLM